MFEDNKFPQTKLLSPSTLISNAPQLILSLNYFVYNALWTRMHSELEWNGFGVFRTGRYEYRPRRDSRPRCIDSSFRTCTVFRVLGR